MVDGILVAAGGARSSAAARACVEAMRPAVCDRTGEAAVADAKTGLSDRAVATAVPSPMGAQAPEGAADLALTPYEAVIGARSWARRRSADRRT
jgi:hypothetical protein